MSSRAPIDTKPVRANNVFLAGYMALDGNFVSNDWQEMLPHTFRPWVINPASGTISNANPAISSSYPMFTLVAKAGDTHRSRRLRELVESAPSFTPEDVREFHTDRVDPTRRDLVRLGLHLRDVQGHTFGSAANSALHVLSRWYTHHQGKMDLSHYGVAVAHWLVGAIRPWNGPDLVPIYGIGEDGMNLFLKQTTNAIDQNPNHTLSADETLLVEILLDCAWGRTLDALGCAQVSFQTSAFPDPCTISQQTCTPTPAQLAAWYDTNILNRTLKKWQFSAGISLDPATFVIGPMLAWDISTNLSQVGDSYSQWVPVGRTDGAEAMMALGSTELDGSAFQFTQQNLWETGQLKSSFTTPAAIQANAAQNESPVTLNVP